MADEPDHATGGLTALETAYTPRLDHMAARGRSGLVCTVPKGLYPGSETAILTILGYPPDALPHGRGYLEALGCGLRYPAGEWFVARYKLRSPDVFPKVKNNLSNHVFHPLTSVTGLVYDTINPYPGDGNAEATFWSHDKKRSFSPFPPLSLSSTGIRSAIICAVPLLKGIAVATGMDCVVPQGATGDTGTDYEAKATAALQALTDHDIVILHIEACDYASHAKDFHAKIKAIESIDRFIIAPLLHKAENAGGNLTLAVLPDHPSLCRTGAHTSGPVPLVVYNPNSVADSTICYSEKDAARGEIMNLSELYKLYEAI